MANEWVDGNRGTRSLPARGVVRSILALLLILGPAVAGLEGQEAPDDLADQGLLHIQAIESAFRRAIARAEPAVVSVFTIDATRTQFDLSSPNSDDPESIRFAPFRFGSGVVIGKEGLVLTAYHVVRSTLETSNHILQVRLHDGSVHGAYLHAADPRSDLAVVRLDADRPLDLTPIEVGDGSKLFRGQFVLAMGNTDGTAAADGVVSASWGIVSNIERRAVPLVPPDEEIQSLMVHGVLVQTDARLNMGISGGALIDTRGRMVGVTMALAAATGLETPGGFAIPTDELVRRIIDTLAKGREVEYGFIGIEPATLAPGHPALAGAPGGAQVNRIYAIVPAHRAGLSIGDVIVAIDGKPVAGSNDLIVAVGSRLVGTELDAVIVRNGRRMDLRIPLAKYPVRGRVFAKNKRPNPYGIRVDHLSTILGERGVVPIRVGPFGEVFDDSPTAGVVIREVENGSLAYQHDLRERQIITAVNGNAVYSPDDFEKEIARATLPVRLNIHQRPGPVEFDVPPADSALRKAQ